MKHTQNITIVVNGKTIQAAIQLDAPGLETEDCINAQMIFAAVGSGQNTSYYSRHHKDRAATVVVNPPKETDVPIPQALRMVA